MIPAHFQVVFSEINGVRGWCDNMHWRAELFDHSADMGGPGWLTRPVAVAWGSTVLGGILGPGINAVLDYILVPDDFRRRGYAKALVGAIDERFGGGMLLTDAISPEGQALLDSVCPEAG